MNLNDINHWLRAGKLAYEGFHKVKEFIDSFDEPADRSKFYIDNYNDATKDLLYKLNHEKLYIIYPYDTNSK